MNIRPERGLTAVLWIALPLMLALTATSLRGEILARAGLAGWDGRLRPVAFGDPAALGRARMLEPWRAELSIAMGLRHDLSASERETHLIAAIEAAPAAALGWLALGSLRAEQADPAGALRACRIAGDLDRMGSATQIRVAAIAINLMDLDSALPSLRQAAALSPDTRLPEALGLATLVTSDPILLDSLVPPGAINHLRAGRLLEAGGLAAAAEIQYEKASSANWTLRAIHDSHVRFHLERGERSDAIRLIRIRLSAMPRDTALRVQLTQLLMDSARPTEALDELQTAEAADPGSDEVANQRALFELERGDAARAVELAGTLVGRRPEMAAARITLARALWKRGDRPGAARELTQAELLDRSRPDVQLLLARLSRETGDAAEAAARYRRAIELGYVSPAREELSTLSGRARPDDGG